MTQASLSDLGDGPWGVYVHVPWCRRRCPYCSFYVEVDRGPDHADYVAGLSAELVLRRGVFAAAGPPTTVFFGGGTPSRLPPAHLATILQAIAPAPGAEVSLEANPEDLAPATLNALRQAGITRLSVGLQTFQAKHARLLNRASTVAQSRAALAAVKDAGFSSFSVDLIFGLPNQTLDDLAADLDALADLAPPHVSLYGLTYEPDTPFDRARQAGKLVPLDDERWRDMADLIAERLGQLGLRRYEISNFALPGHESRHNQLYWTDRPYLGIGPSAHSYEPDGGRRQNPADLAAWRADPAGGERHHPTPDQAGIDLVISAMRGSEGLDLRRLAARTRLAPNDALLIDLVNAGLLHRTQGQVALTPSGVPVADGVIERLCGSLRPVE